MSGTARAVLAVATTAALCLAGCDFTQELGLDDGGSLGGAPPSSSSGSGGARGGTAEGAAEWAWLSSSFMAQRPADIGVDAAGGVAVAGSYQNFVEPGGGPLPTLPKYDGFLVKLSEGHVLWSLELGGFEGCRCNGVRIDRAGNVVVAGGFGGAVDFGGDLLTATSESNAFVAKYTPDGKHLWSKRFGEKGGSGAAYHIGVDPVGNVLVAMSYSGGIVDFGCEPLYPAGSSDALIAELDPLGNCRWSKRFGDCAASAAALDPSGNAILVGNFGGAVNFGGGRLQSAGGADVFVAKFDPDGHHLWSKRFGDAADQLGTTVAVTGDGSVAVGGWFWSTIDFGGQEMVSHGAEDGFVAMLDPDGSHLWSKSFGSSGRDAVLSVAADALGGVSIGGYFNDTVDLDGSPLVSAGGDDIVVAKYDGGGKPRWSRRFGDARDQYATGVAAGAAGNVYFTAAVYGSVDLGDGPMSSVGGMGALVAELPP